MGLPVSTIQICSGVRLNPSYEHTLHFDTTEAQLSYFEAKVVKTLASNTYLRKNNSIRVPASYENAQYWSYLFCRNGGKTFFYFITSVEYINDNIVTLNIELDVMQTYMFDYELLPCFVEREHTADDTIGINTLDESLELGKLVVNDRFELNLDEYCILVLSTFNPGTTTEETQDKVLYAKYDGVFSGLGCYAINMGRYIDWGKKLKDFDAWGYSDGIISMWAYPKSLVQLRDNEDWNASTLVKTVANKAEFAYEVNRQNFLNGYTPRNNKLLTYPYNFIYATSNAGSAGVFRYERFTDPVKCKFICAGAISPEGSAVLYPMDYNGTAQNYDEGITLGGFPSCAWNSDTYKLWLAQNQNTHTFAMGSAVLQVAGGVAMAVGSGGLASGVGVGMVASGLSQIGGLMTTQKDQSIQPPQARGGFSNSVNSATGFQTFSIYKKSIDSYHAKIIDDYFDLYGYSTKKVKVPNRNVRENWTYTKTVGCKILTNINTEDSLKIESIYNNGITFWVNGDLLGDYTQNNTVKG